MPRPLILLLALAVLTAAEPAFTVGAAASLRDALDDALAAHARTAGGSLGTASYAASSAIARQVEQGAPLQLVITADQRWMDHLAERRLIDPASRTDVAANRLVLAVPAGIALPAAPLADDPTAYARFLSRRWSTGDPAHVPAGAYAEAALRSLGWWEAARPALIPAADVRAAMRLLELGEVDAAILYASDVHAAAPATRIAIAATFPASSHPPIRYPAALVGAGNPAARAFLAWLRGADGQAVLAAHGFTAP